MNKIGEQKALEAYPEHRVIRYGPLYAYGGTDTPSEYDENIVTRKAFIEGYDQAMQDFLEKASKYLFDNLPHTLDITQTVSFINNFKNYIQNE